LIDDNDGSEIEIFTERTDGRKGDDIGDARLFERTNVSTIIDFSGSEPVTTAVARKKNERRTVELSRQQRVRRVSERI